MRLVSNQVRRTTDERSTGRPVATGVSSSSGSYGGNSSSGMPDMQGMMSSYMGMANQMADFKAKQDEKQMNLAYGYRDKEAQRDFGNQSAMRDKDISAQERQQASQLAFQRARAQSEDMFRQNEFAVQDRQRNQTEIRDIQKFERQTNSNEAMETQRLGVQQGMQTQSLQNQRAMQTQQIGSTERLQASQLANQRTMQTEREGGQTNRLGMQIGSQQTMQQRGFEQQTNMANLQNRFAKDKTAGDRAAAQAMFRSSGGAGRGALASGK